MELWNYGTMELWNYGTMELWNYGTMELWNYGTMELWNYVVIRTSGPEGSSCVGPGAPFMAISPYVHVGLDNEKWVGY